MPKPMGFHRIFTHRFTTKMVGVHLHGAPLLRLPVLGQDHLSLAAPGAQVKCSQPKITNRQ